MNTQMNTHRSTLYVLDPILPIAIDTRKPSINPDHIRSPKSPLIDSHLQSELGCLKIRSRELTRQIVEEFHSLDWLGCADHQSRFKDALVSEFALKCSTQLGKVTQIIQNDSTVLGLFVHNMKVIRDRASKTACRYYTKQLGRNSLPDRVTFECALQRFRKQIVQELRLVHLAMLSAYHVCLHAEHTQTISKHHPSDDFWALSNFDHSKKQAIPQTIFGSAERFLEAADVLKANPQILSKDDHDTMNPILLITSHKPNLTTKSGQMHNHGQKSSVSEDQSLILHQHPKTVIQRSSAYNPSAQNQAPGFGEEEDPILLVSILRPLIYGNDGSVPQNMITPDSSILAVPPNASQKEVVDNYRPTSCESKLPRSQAKHASTKPCKAIDLIPLMGIGPPRMVMHNMKNYTTKTGKDVLSMIHWIDEDELAHLSHESQTPNHLAPDIDNQISQTQEIEELYHEIMSTVPGVCIKEAQQYPAIPVLIPDTVPHVQERLNTTQPISPTSSTIPPIMEPQIRKMTRHVSKHEVHVTADEFSVNRKSAMDKVPSSKEAADSHYNYGGYVPVASLIRKKKQQLVLQDYKQYLSTIETDFVGSVVLKPEPEVPKPFAASDPTNEIEINESNSNEHPFILPIDNENDQINATVSLKIQKISSILGYSYLDQVKFTIHLTHQYKQIEDELEKWECVALSIESRERAMIQWIQWESQVGSGIPVQRGVRKDARFIECKCQKDWNKVLQVAKQRVLDACNAVVDVDVVGTTGHDLITWKGLPYLQKMDSDVDDFLAILNQLRCLPQP